MDIRYAGLLLVDRHEDIFLNNLPVCLSGHGIDWNLAEVSGGDEVVEGLRSFLLVERVLRDNGAKCGEV